MLKRVGNVAYELEFPYSLSSIHPIFHIFMVRKCVGDPSTVVSLEEIYILDSLSYEEVSIEILDRQVHRLRTKDMDLVKVLWRNQRVENTTWEVEEGIKSKY